MNYFNDKKTEIKDISKNKYYFKYNFEDLSYENLENFKIDNIKYKKETIIEVENGKKSKLF